MTIVSNIKYLSYRATIVALCVSLSGCPVAPSSPLVLRHVSASESLPDNDIRLLNWNIYKQYDNPDWQQEFAALGARWAPNLVTLQEVNVSPHDHVMPFAEDWGYRFAANLVTADGGYSGVMTAGTAEASQAQSLLSKETEPLTETPKVVLLTEYELAPSGAPLLVGNIHGINFVTHDAFATQILQLGEYLADHKGPILLSGDFNTWAEARLVALRQTTEKLGLKAVEFPEGRKSFLNTPLDHIYHSQDLQLTIADLPEGFETSDHVPMIANFRYKGTVAAP